MQDAPSDILPPPFDYNRVAPDCLVLIAKRAGLAGRMTTMLRGPEDWLDWLEQNMRQGGVRMEPPAQRARRMVHG